MGHRAVQGGEEGPRRSQRWPALCHTRGGASGGREQEKPTDSVATQGELTMPRPVSWLSRLAEIRRSVKNSVRSHYERKDIERLFQIQPRAAQTLIRGIAPSAKVGSSFLLARGDLEGFLDRVAEGAEPTSLL